ncbi:MAG: porphobilinogen synthase [Kiritimatiellaeota bacterium]|nr:porphobilinogen synthase [Kiritimatiellota bacterium]
MNTFPDIRLRRLRRTPSLRRLFDMPLPGPEKFIWPVFVIAGRGQRQAIDAMPGQYRYSVDTLLKDLRAVVDSGVGGILIFGLVDDGRKDGVGSAAYDERGPVQQAVRAVHAEYPHLVIFTDVCLCAYTTHGHCGPLLAPRSAIALRDGESAKSGATTGDVDNDASIELLAKTAVSHAAAGADGVAPSAMMDGQVQAIRSALSGAGFQQTLLMSYSTKFASAMYGPFREAEQSAPQHGDRRGYQASYGDARQALRESALDEAEGADILMVKPSLFYLDIIARLRASTELPMAVYNVSGEYSMLIAAADRGWGVLRDMVQESSVALVRSGADLLISYWANRYREFFS